MYLRSKKKKKLWLKFIIKINKKHYRYCIMLYCCTMNSTRENTQLAFRAPNYPPCHLDITSSHSQCQLFTPTETRTLTNKPLLSATQQTLVQPITIVPAITYIPNVCQGIVSHLYCYIRGRYRDSSPVTE